jgi:peptide/nickel transport system permease protein
MAMLLAFSIAVPLGLVAGFYRGWLDAVIARVTDVLLAFPFLILALGLGAILGPSPTTATLALGIAAIPGLTRITRAEALALREADFVPAAIASGAGGRTILVRHLLPNMAPTLIVQATALIPRIIIGEAALSFLGLGVQPPDSDWGGKVKENKDGIVFGIPAALIPAAAIAVLAISVNLVADWVLNRTTSLKGGRG